MIQRVLIANRGEIALRILRACREMGKQAVAVYTHADQHLRHLTLADDTVCIGERSYLSPDNIIMAARNTGCDAIHPGYGLLSEDAGFARLVEDSGLVFIGARPDDLDRLGDKQLARQIFAELGLQPVPGAALSDPDAGSLAEQADHIGFPLLVKASYGGGGRGIRLVSNAEELAQVVETASIEAKSNFGRGELYLEKFLPHCRHVELQVAGDGNGGAVHFGTRDCSVQRKYQKIIEEAPAADLETQALDQLLLRSVEAISSLKYRGLATLEFLYSEGRFYFMEINNRLQVEHPVTEMITGVDLVQCQIELAEDAAMLPMQESISFRGCAIECRINAEDKNFVPSPGRVIRCIFPGGPGVRVDTHLYAGYEVPHQYDSLLAKVVTVADNRAACLRRMQAALSECEIVGIETNIPALLVCLAHADFGAVRHHTGWLDGGEIL